MDTFSKSERSRIMACVKSSGNKSTEVCFISLLKNEGIIGWRRNYPLFGRPDFVFRTARVVVFIDGCFWHGCQKHCRMPASNRDYWNKKISRNKARDRNVTRVLKSKGWKVIRVWEHDLKGNSIKRKLKAIKKAVHSDSTL